MWIIHINFVMACTDTSSPDVPSRLHMAHDTSWGSSRDGYLTSTSVTFSTFCSDPEAALAHSVLYCSFPPSLPFPERCEGNNHFLSIKTQIAEAEQALSGLVIDDIYLFFCILEVPKSNELYTSLKLRKWTWHLHSDWGQTSYLAWLPGNSKGFLLVFKNAPYIR